MLKDQPMSGSSLRRRDFLAIAWTGAMSIVGTSVFGRRGWAWPPAAAPNNAAKMRTQELNGEGHQMGYASFVEETKRKASAALLKVSDSGEVTERTYNFDGKYANVIVVRGGAIEKAVIYHLKFPGMQTPGANDVSFGEVFQMEIFPENPRCPMGHLSTEWLSGVPYSMNLDLFPAVKISQDLEKVRGAMDRVAEQFGLDKVKMREGQDIQYNMAHFAEPLASKVGCRLRHLTDKDLEMFMVLHRVFFDSYLEILAERKHDSFSETDVQLKLLRNGKWLEYFVLKDQAVRSALENGFPPELLIDIGFPPSATF